MRIGDLMTHPVTTVRPELSADDAWDTMRRQREFPFANPAAQR